MAKDQDIDDIAKELDQARKDFDKAQADFITLSARRNEAKRKIDENEKLLRDKLKEKYGV